MSIEHVDKYSNLQARIAKATELFQWMDLERSQRLTHEQRRQYRRCIAEMEMLKRSRMTMEGSKLDRVIINISLRKNIAYDTVTINFCE